MFYDVMVTWPWIVFITKGFPWLFLFFFASFAWLPRALPSLTLQIQCKRSWSLLPLSYFELFNLAVKLVSEDLGIVFHSLVYFDRSGLTLLSLYLDSCSAPVFGFRPQTQLPFSGSRFSIPSDFYHFYRWLILYTDLQHFVFIDF